MSSNDVVVDKKELEVQVLEIDYSNLNEGTYRPSLFALEFINFIKLVNGPAGEENKSPSFHMEMIDQIIKNNSNLFVAFRGSAKTTVLHEYLFLYLALYGSLPGFGEINVAIYVSDTIENGVKSMRKNLEFRFQKSDFLQQYIKKAKFTEDRWEFENADGKKLCIRGFGVTTGVRGFKEYGERPTYAAMDDLMSDKNAESATIIEDMEKIIYKAVRQSLHPKRRKVTWTGTPFNKKDPLYKAAGSKGWNTKVYPVCEKFPCERAEFSGAWEDRFTYDAVMEEYQMLKDNGKLDAFYQEMMLRIMSDEEKLIKAGDIIEFDRSVVLANQHKYNWYITTDFATSEKESSDYSVISVWALSSNGDWLWVDGILEKRTMEKNIDDVFKFVQMYQPMEVGIETSGQQGGFVSWIRTEMLRRNTIFNLVEVPSVGNKFIKFQQMVPRIKMHKIWLPKGMDGNKVIAEAWDELNNISANGFKSSHDDFCDTITMIQSMNEIRPEKDTYEISGKKKSSISSMYDDEATKKVSKSTYIC